MSMPVIPNFAQMYFRNGVDIALQALSMRSKYYFAMQQFQNGCLSGWKVRVSSRYLYRIYSVEAVSLNCKTSYGFDISIHNQYLYALTNLINQMLFPFKKNNLHLKPNFHKDKQFNSKNPESLTVKLKFCKTKTFCSTDDLKINLQDKKNLSAYLIQRPTYKHNRQLSRKQSVINVGSLKRIDSATELKSNNTSEKKRKTFFQYGVEQFLELQNNNNNKLVVPQNTNNKLKKVSRLALKNSNKDQIKDKENCQPQKKIINSSNQKTPQQNMLNVLSCKYILHEILGKGSYGVVRKAEAIESKKMFAIKQFNLNRTDQMKTRLNILRESKVISKLFHENIIKFQQIIYGQKSIHLVMEFGGQKTLKKYLREKNQFTQQEAKPIFFKITKAIQYCHSKRVIHRDLKLENIMINGLQVKLADFGFSVVNEDESLLTNYCGTPSYMSPEIVKKVPYNGYKADIWALGVCLHLLLTGKYPFAKKEQKPVFQSIQRGQLKIEESLSFNAKNLIKKILNSQPECRPSIRSILQNSWFIV